jgi:hypothetical protein
MITAKAIRSVVGNTIFSVRFRKRTTGEMRTMVCRVNCYKNVKGTGPAYDFESKNLMPVFDLQKDGWRSIPLENIEQLKIRGATFQCRGDCD